MKYLVSMIAAAGVSAMGVPASAATLFSTTLSSANETVPNPSTATGSGTLLLSTSQTSIDVFLNWAGLTGPATGGHVHCCAFQGANAPVAIDFGPSATATGSLTRTYDLTLLATYTTAFVTASGGTAAGAQAAFVAGLLGGKAYYNVHTQTNPGGEIRGQLAATAVPEAATWGMMIAGMGITGAALRRRRTFAVAA